MSQTYITTTHVPTAPAPIFALLRSAASELNLVAREAPGEFALDTPLGSLTASSENRGVRISLSASNEGMLQSLQDRIDAYIEYHRPELSLVWSTARSGSLPANLTIARVTAVDRISPSYFRVRVETPDIARLSRDGLHFRLLIEPAGYEGCWPSIGEDGRTQWPGGGALWLRPVYTVRSIDVDAGTLDFDVFIYPGGRISAWCGAVQSGAEIGLMGPGGGWYPEARWIGLFGDETALPAIARILEAMPDDAKGIAAVVAKVPADIQQLKKPTGVELTWLLRQDGRTLPDLLSSVEIPVAERFVWFASERSESQEAKIVLERRGLSKEETRIGSYWTR